MIQVAVLDDYQETFKQIVDIKITKTNINLRFLMKPSIMKVRLLIALQEFEALFIMRERTPITKNLLENLPNLKYIMTSGMRNNAINLEVTKKEGF